MYVVVFKDYGPNEFYAFKSRQEAIDFIADCERSVGRKLEYAITFDGNITDDCFVRDDIAF